MGQKLLTLLFIFLINCSILFVHSLALDPPYGQLEIQGKYLTNLGGSPVQLRGMSLFWSQWMPQFYNEETLKHLRAEWNSNIVRAAMGIESGGYLDNPETEYDKIKTVIEAAIDVGIYVIVDWHEERADQHIPQAIAFFTNISQNYGSYPHIIYEIWNEPNGPDWPTIKAYAEQVIPAIRANDPNNIIVVGTPTWSQDVDIAANDPLNLPNVAYTLHYYAGTHKQPLRDKATIAINKGLCIFITEYGTVDASGDGAVDTSESQLWWAFDDQNKLSYVNWAIEDKNEGAAALTPGTTAEQVGDSLRWTQSGQLVNKKYQSTDQGLNGGNPTGPTMKPKPTTTPPVGNACPAGWYTSNVNSKKCYKFISDRQTFSSANNNCAQTAHGSTLVSIADAFENTEINKQIQSQIGSCDKIYIDLVRNSGTWNWQNGDNGSYRNWDGGYPDGDNLHDCAFMENGNGRWQDTDCNIAECYICQLIIS